MSKIVLDNVTLNGNLFSSLNKSYTTVPEMSDVSAVKSELYGEIAEIKKDLKEVKTKNGGVNKIPERVENILNGLTKEQTSFLRKEYQKLSELFAKQCEVYAKLNETLSQAEHLTGIIDREKQCKVNSDNANHLRDQRITDFVNNILDRLSDDRK